MKPKHMITSKPAPRADFSQVKCVQGYERIRDAYPAYLSDESRLTSNGVDYLFLPKNEAELAAVVQELSSHRIPMTTAGARTGIVGGSVPFGGAVISLERLDRVEYIHFDTQTGEWRLRAQAYVNLNALEEMLSNKRLPDLENHADPDVRADFARFQADPDSYFYPPDPTEMSASLGGSAATNASGALTYRYGPTRAWVRGLRILLANGELLDITRGECTASERGEFSIVDCKGNTRTFAIPSYKLPETKCASGFYAMPGMDLVDLFIGSEGVLGIITSVEVALLKRQPKLSVVQFMENERQAIALTQLLRTDQDLQPDFIEFYSGNALNLLRRVQAETPYKVSMPPIPEVCGAALFIEIAYAPDIRHKLNALKRLVSSIGADPALSWAAHEPRELMRLKAFRHLLPETVNSIIAERKQGLPDLHKLSTDLAVPDAHLEDIWQLYQQHCDRLGLEWVAFGHIGNNHIHVNILPHTIQEQQQGMELYEMFAKKAVEWGGAVSAEHGIGKIKHKLLRLMFNPQQIGEMHRVKTAFDPHNLLNPGVLFPLEELA